MKDTETLLARRARFLGPNVPTFYDTPLHLVRGDGVWLWDADGKKYLDCYNNVPHVGHCHPKVVQAISAQATKLNTHTRYLHEGILDYAERLTGTFDHGLDQVILVCTGSEANDIALRMAEAVTGKTGIIATDNTYHGNTKAVSQLSSRRPPIGGYPPNVRLVPAPSASAPVGGSREGQAQAFAAAVQSAIDDLEARGIGFAGFLACPIFANEGLPTLETDFLEPVTKTVRAAGGLFLCDEVQPGFGRVGSHFWGHDRYGIAPDVVTLGKPMANGHPVAAVVARSDVMAAFREAFGYFNTFGGNPVSAAAALATLEVIEDEGLQANAHAVGAYKLDLFRGLSHPAITDVRGEGMFFAIDLAIDGAPAKELALQVVEAAKDRGILMGKIGKHGDTLKLRPPLPFSRANAEQAAETLQAALDSCPL